MASVTVMSSMGLSKRDANDLTFFVPILVAAQTAPGAFAHSRHLLAESAFTMKDDLIC